MEFKFVPAEDEDIETIYYNVKCVITMFETNKHPYELEPYLMTLYKKIKCHIKEYTALKYRGRKIGFFYFHKDGDRMIIEDIYIDTGYRAMGACSSILRKCISETELPIYAEMYAPNIGAVSVFRNHGFKVTEWLTEMKIIMMYENTEPFTYYGKRTNMRISDWMRESYIENEERKAIQARKRK